MSNLRKTIENEMANRALGYEIEPDRIVDFVLEMMRNYQLMLATAVKPISKDYGRIFS